MFTDILVMGAGMAGVSAAKRLSEHGINKVVVVEGSDRVGGRVKDVQFGGITVEVGANWVHFSNMREHELNPIELLVKDAKLNYIEDDYQDLIFRYRGESNNRVSQKKIKHICAMTRCLAHVPNLSLLV